MEADKIHTTEISQNVQEPIAFFEKDASFTFAFKKTEKLASAVYMITNLFSENEPMKWTLRRKVSDLLSFIVGYKDIKDSNLNDYSYSVRTKILEVVSMLEVSFRAGLLSQMNYSIIKQEFSNLVDVFVVQNTQNKSTNFDSISKNFFDVVDNRHRIPTMTLASTHNLVHQEEVFNVDVSLKDKVSTNDNVVVKRTNRQNVILSLLKKKKELTIKDIAQVIKDCSEKTIQRELIAFIDSGVLKRTGERRWSKYSLAQ